MSADAEYDVLTAVCFLHAMLSPPAPNSELLLRCDKLITNESIRQYEIKLFESRVKYHTDRSLPNILNT